MNTSKVPGDNEPDPWRRGTLRKTSTAERTSRDRETGECFRGDRSLTITPQFTHARPVSDLHPTSSTGPRPTKRVRDTGKTEALDPGETCFTPPSRPRPGASAGVVKTRPRSSTADRRRNVPQPRGTQETDRDAETRAGNDRKTGGRRRSDTSV